MLTDRQIERLRLKIGHILLKNNESIKFFCKEKVGISQAAFFNYFYHGRRPEYEIAQKITKVTNNEITMKDMGY